ncbi:MAG TPA: helix-turn-helix domain-containing protein [Caulobacteraceae bacterium]|jgi:DNA-binding MarR family transcriptional regulator|nr:helix-turn-helix domain-containing protein [Caulobacteraceae bacterium]
MSSPRSQATPAAREDGVLSVEQYRVMAGFRYQLRRFLAFSSRQAQAAGLAPQQYQALLAIKGHTGETAISVGELADQLFIRQHTAAELVNRMETAALVRRAAADRDNRRVAVLLTEGGELALTKLAATHLKELQNNGRLMSRLLELMSKAI